MEALCRMGLGDKQVGIGGQDVLVLSLTRWLLLRNRFQIIPPTSASPDSTLSYSGSSVDSRLDHIRKTGFLNQLVSSQSRDLKTHSGRS